MNAASLLAFNRRKLALNLALWPAKVRFASDKSAREFDVSFGELQDEASLHESGQGIQHHRLAVLVFPVPTSDPAFTPSAMMTFTVTQTTQPGIQGKSYRIESPRASHGEPALKFNCSRLEP
ncbi:MAG TPA: hypothetical protein VHD61_15715 [Lacunisphaera sp.]|nr:hypothetical protein [Lacunisphaera sp.]